MEREAYERLREIEQAHWWFSGRREILSDQLGQLALPPGARILEVGCGTGGNLAMLSAFGRVSAVEPEDEARAWAAARSGIDVRPGALPDALPPFDEPFDLVAALDVLEHVDEDVASVSALARLLAPGGHLLATVPANPWMWSGHDVRHHHKRRYVLGGIVRVFREGGLEVRRATYFNTLLFPMIGAVRLVKAALGSTGGDDDAVPGPALNRSLHGVFSAEKGLLRRADLPFGVSLLVIGRRPCA